MRGCRRGLGAMMALVSLISCGLPTQPANDVGFDLVQTLVDRAARVEELGVTAVGPFEVGARVLRVDGHVVQVFEYSSREIASDIASRVSPDGTKVVATDQATFITWTGPPHLFLRDRWIAAYIGSESAILGVLLDVMGPQFAGVSD